MVLCDLGPGDLVVGAGGSELLLHVDPSSPPERWQGKDWSVIDGSSRHARLRIGARTCAATAAGRHRRGGRRR